MWTMISGETAGRSHLNEGLPCQDKTYFEARDGAVAMALADGAGSAAHSDLGAYCAARAAVGYVLDNFDSLAVKASAREAMENVLDSVRENLRRLAAEKGYAVSELASTLLVVGIKGARVFAAHVGDGLIARVKNGELAVVSPPMNGEFLNETFFVTDENALAGMEVLHGSTEGTEAFLLMSDGSGENFYDRRTGILAPGLKKVVDGLAVMPQEKRNGYLHEVLDFITKANTQDDCSLGFMLREKTGEEKQDGNDERL